ncbi:MAG: hypothetical protein GX594_03020 [Pirellulaceae bacterium]|nr:hypothetical protein [Pirellulaceae bacterium]
MNNSNSQCDAAESQGDEFLELVVCHLEGRLAAAERARLNHLLSESSGNRDLFVAVCTQASMLASCVGIDAEQNEPEYGVEAAAREESDLEPAEPPPQPLPASTPLSIPFSTPFDDGFVFSYMVASVFVCLLLLGFWAYKVSPNHDSSLANGAHSTDDIFQSAADSRGLTAPGKSLHNRPAPVFVGRITGMAGVKWSDDPDYFPPFSYASVSLGRKYKLDSGLLEITYDSGAKVILEGPCSYEVDSTVGGYLSLGKLVAKVESGEWKVESDNCRRLTASGSNNAMAQTPEAVSLRLLSESTNPQIHSPLSTLPSPLFTVRTPTAVVTDLGTEFGVEVNANGDTTSHVFQGMVLVQAGSRGCGDAGIWNLEKRPATAVAGGESDKAVALVAGQSICVGGMRETHKEPAAGEMVRFTHPTASPQFVRRIYQPPKLLDLLDIVAGGDGTGKRRERGIDQASGMQDTWYADNVRFDDHEYHPATWNNFVDGVFVPYVPSYRSRTVQLDSSGNVFNGFTDRRMIDGVLKHEIVNGKTTGSIWARAADARSSPEGWKREGLVYALNNEETFMPAGRGLMLLHANAGITFDLAAVREMFEDAYPARFRATAGMGDGPRAHPHAFGMADVWIFVDGRLNWKRLDLCAKDGAVPIDLPLGPDDGFLTIVSTNGRYGQGYDWVVMGDPTLEMEPVGENLTTATTERSAKTSKIQ